jgi:LuxR family quorum-sensing transcriptional regulator LasR
MNQFNQKLTGTAEGSWQAMASSAVQLTAKEQEILLWAAKGKSTWEISRIQGRTESAVNFHMCNIRRKFGVSSLKAALVMALDCGLIDLH